MREITAGELSKILKEHKKWIDTEEKEGKRANLSNADLYGADLSSANLSGTVMQYADLSRADLINADLSDAYLRRANLSRADLSEVFGLNIEQLSKVKTLYKAKLDPELIVQVKDRYPHLLKKPKPEK